MIFLKRSQGYSFMIFFRKVHKAYSFMIFSLVKPCEVHKPDDFFEKSSQGYIQLNRNFNQFCFKIYDKDTWPFVDFTQIDNNKSGNQNQKVHVNTSVELLLHNQFQFNYKVCLSFFTNESNAALT